LYNFLGLQEEIELINFEKRFFDNPESLINFVKNCDCIVHLAGMNRHEDQQVIYDTNVLLVTKLLEACEASKSTPQIVFSSSIQENQDNLYGKSKKVGSKLLDDWSKKNNTKVASLLIPNVFGPFGRPFYNSVVPTFCHLVISGEEPVIITDSNLKLIYINELISEIYETIKEGRTGSLEIAHTFEIKVSELAKKLKKFHSKYVIDNEFPDIKDAMDLALFNTFRCFIPYDHYPRLFTKHEDDRGIFTEIVRANSSGQFSFSTTKPGITRGNHFHTRKAERFAVIKGKAKIQLRKINTAEIIEYTLDGDSPAFVDMPIWYTHNITNIGSDELIALFWINEPYNPEDSDTYYVNV